MKRNANLHAAASPWRKNGERSAGAAEAPATQLNNKKCQQLINWARVQLGKGQALQQTTDVYVSMATLQHICSRVDRPMSL